MTDFGELAGQTTFDQPGFFHGDLQNMMTVRNFQVAQLKITSINALGEGGNPMAGEVLVAAGFGNGLQSYAAPIQPMSEQNC